MLIMAWPVPLGTRHLPAVSAARAPMFQLALDGLLFKFSAPGHWAPLLQLPPRMAIRPRMCDRAPIAPGNHSVAGATSRWLRIHPPNSRPISTFKVCQRSYWRSGINRTV